MKNNKVAKAAILGLGVLAAPGALAQSIESVSTLSVEKLDDQAGVDCMAVYAGEPCPVVLTEAEENKIGENIQRLKALNVIEVWGLTETLVARNCPYYMPCPAEVQQGIRLKREKAEKVEALVEFAEGL